MKLECPKDWDCLPWYEDGVPSLVPWFFAPHEAGVVIETPFVYRGWELTVSEVPLPSSLGLLLLALAFLRGRRK